MEKENIITIIKHDHKPLKEGIQILTSENSKPAQKKAALKKFLLNLKLHAKSEEASLYEEIVEKKELHDMTLEAFEEHSVADLLSDELEASGYEEDFSDELMAKAKVLAEIVEHHIEEEENEMFSTLKKESSEEELVEMGQEYKKHYQALTREMSTERTRVKPKTEREATF